jgi:hypothetical protein
VGFAVGYAVGENDGNRVGLIDGDSVGDLVGDGDGTSVGTLLGEGDGTSVGANDGETDGRSLGEIDGSDVGLDDGDSLGAADGASITSTEVTANLSLVVFVAASRSSFDVKFFVSSRIVTVDSINASTLRFSSRRPAAASPVHDTSLRIVTATSTVTPSSSSAAIKSELIDSSTSVLLKGQVTTKSDLAKVWTTATMEFVGTVLGEEEGDIDGIELGLKLGLKEGNAVGDIDEVGEADGALLGEAVHLSPNVLTSVLANAPPDATSVPSNNIL